MPKQLLVGLWLLCSHLLCAQSVQYTLSLDNHMHHEAQISVSYTQLPKDKPLELWMSRSSPGRYALHEFVKNVYSVQAFDSKGKVLTTTRPNAYSWLVSGHDGSVTVSYTLFGDHSDGTYAGIDAEHAQLNAPATWLWAVGTEQRPITLQIRLPEGKNWQIATQLEKNTAGQYTAPNHYYFMDSPILMGALDVRQWQIKVGNLEQLIQLAVLHEGTAAEVDAYQRWTEAVVNEQIAVWGGLPKFDYGRYVFLCNYLPQAKGDGMEHRNSTMISSGNALADAAGQLIGTVSHEFFHVWNVERLRPRSLEPFDFTRANMSDELWFAEGFTTYYGGLLLCRAGVDKTPSYLKAMGNLLNGMLNAPGRKYYSAVEMSRQAVLVDAGVSIDATNRQNTYLSYYPFGAAIGLGLDLALRTQFGLSLDGYLRLLWQRNGKGEQSYAMDDLREGLASYTKDNGFADRFFAAYISGKETMPYADLLAGVGLLLRKAQPGVASLGMPASVWQVKEGRLRLGAGSLVGSPLYAIGMEREDVLLAIDDVAIDSKDVLQQVLAKHKPGDVVVLRYLQRGNAVTKNLTLAEDNTLEVVTMEEAGQKPSFTALQQREAWLGSQLPKK